MVEEYGDYVDSIEEEKIILKQINATTNVKLSIPLEYKNERYVEENKLDGNAVVKLTGKYVDKNGEEYNIAKEYTINLRWTGKRDVNVSSGVVKYVDFGSGIIVQSLIKVDNSIQNTDVELNENDADLFHNYVPTKETDIKVKAPTYDEMEPSNVMVSATKLEATNGQNAENIIFDNNNWNYDNESKEISIKVKNDPQEMIYSEDQNAVYNIENRVQENRLYNVPGVDEFLVTYTYLGAHIPEGTVNVEDNINVSQIYYGGDSSESSAVLNQNMELGEQVGNLISLDNHMETENISKKYGYFNYRNDEKVEKEIVSNEMINISYKDIVENIKVKDADVVYVFDDKEEKNNDTYYKKIMLSKSNFLEILGNEGKIQIFDENGNLLEEVNVESWKDDDVLAVGLRNQKKIEIVTSKPISEGVLIIKKVRAISGNTISREQYRISKGIKFNEEINAKYQYVENDVNVENINYSVELTDTNTKATLNIDRENLATLTMNENVTFKVLLNNNEENSDIYGKSHFEIEMPSFITGLEIKDTNMSYASGLEIENVVYEENKIKIDVKGIQNNFNAGNYNNGTNIIISANIDVDDYTPSKEDSIKLTYINEEATTYIGETADYATINYSAPNGLVTINEISNYADNKFITSVRQGLKEDIIDVHRSEHTATMGIVLINNNKNEISNLRILGRFPYKGIKDPITGDDMNVTIDASSITRIAGLNQNNQRFKTYYSEKQDATADINDSKNGWDENLEIERARSYLIVPENEDYTMEPAEVLRFSYEFGIPGNLGREEYITGTYLAEYRNNSEIGEFDEKSCPDIVRLTTGVGPELEFSAEMTDEELYEGKEFALKINVKNIGKEEVNNIKIRINKTSNAIYQKMEMQDESLVRLEENNDKELIIAIDKLEIRKEMPISIWLMVDTSNSSTSSIDMEAYVDADNLGRTIHQKIDSREIKKPEFTIREEISGTNTGEEENEWFYEGDEIELRTAISTIEKDPKENVVVTKKISNEFEVISYNMEIIKSKSSERTEVGEVTFNDETGEIIGKIDRLEIGKTYYLVTKLRAKNIPENYDFVTGKIYSKVKADGTKEYEANKYEIKIAKVKIEIVQLTDVKNEYINIGDSVEYKFRIKNIGKILAPSITFKDQMPDGMVIKRAEYTKDGVNYKKADVNEGEAKILFSLGTEEEVVVNIDAVASTTDGSLEKTAINSGSVEGTNLDEKSSKSVLHIIRAREEDLKEVEYSGIYDDEEDNLKGIVSSNNKISGKIWLDENNNGSFDGEETVNDDFRNISVDLLEVESGDIIKTTKIGSLGEYRFAGVPGGRYIVVFEYDTIKYGITSYKKSGVSESSNSDAYAGNINKNGNTINVAMTDEIEVGNEDVDSVNLGLVYAARFDLELSMGISKVTIQNETGTKTTNYQNNTFVKEEIAARNVDGSRVLVEYKMIIKNTGDVEGIARKIVDYVPEGMEFNSTYTGNEKWHSSNDKNIYSSDLEKEEIKPGETRELTLVLEKSMTEENTGMISNQAEIYEDYNVYGISDSDSKPGNKVQKEDDYAIADVLILLKTGEEFIYTSVIVTTITLVAITAFIVYRRVTYDPKKNRKRR